ncbi:hypothetical protein GJ496_011611 [Pomphorhynchus laevis]|nr:hypothetical protein GJ496_011185 [Pomphorhynchus laevis]KAI0987628.1 hypothetical protein GJ496_011611 [Pomphorhynchus laevis]
MLSNNMRISHVSERSRGKKDIPNWLCRFDDDQYVHVLRLIKLLSHYDPAEHHYEGRFIKPPIEINDDGKRLILRFHTYGAGVCFSIRTVMELFLFVLGTNLQNKCMAWKSNDDVTIGRIITVLLNIEAETLENFHSHLSKYYLENLREIFIFKNISMLQDAITFGFNNQTVFDRTVDKGIQHQMEALHKYFFP